MNPIELYGRLIHWVGDGTGAPDTVLHIHAGMAVLFVARVVSRRSLATPIPLGCVYLAELANEILDRVNHGQWMPDTFSDVVNTVFWPTVLFIGLRIRRARLEHPSQQDRSTRRRAYRPGRPV
ncbi:hypothetical protein IAG41_11515 [Sphingomonas sp. JC676]|uniref:hypothetical protein n=1 Tax=Sphingomonas sp. JC676 TaxID=2768065 RepID=UPI0016577786|nr:hypothetical protein [Sphingomonas sp. JC676]MBC9033023.1 hypothetical protein [Sphingomonas sp. JC676]